MPLQWRNCVWIPKALCVLLLCPHHVAGHAMVAASAGTLESVHQTQQLDSKSDHFGEDGGGRPQAADARARTDRILEMHWGKFVDNSANGQRLEKTSVGYRSGRSNGERSGSFERATRSLPAAASTYDKRPIQEGATSGECNVNVTVNRTETFNTELATYMNSSDVHLIFFYLDLVDMAGERLSDRNCESENAARTGSPLVWAFKPSSSSYARSYLTMPVTAPRVYSLSLLDEQVKHLWSPHLQVVLVEERPNCWNSLTDEERTNKLLSMVRGLRREIMVTYNVNSSTLWETCYSQPMTKGERLLPDSLSIILPAAPLYFCEDAQGASLNAVERQGLMKAIYYLFLILGIASVPVQFHMTFYLLRRVRRYGIKPPDPWFSKSGNLIIPRHIISAEVPWHMSTAGMMSHHTWFGKKAFHRLKKLSIMLLMVLAYILWPCFLVFYLLSPYQIPPEETVYNCSFHLPALTALGGGVILVIFLWKSFPSGHVHKSTHYSEGILSHDQSSGRYDHPENDTQHFGDDVLKITATMMRSFTAVCFAPTIILKYLATVPEEDYNYDDGKAPNTCSIISRYILGIPVIFLGVIFAVLQETVVQIFTCLLFLTLLIFQKLGSSASCVSCPSGNICLYILFAVCLFFFIAIELALIITVVLVLYLAFEELLCIASITLGAILINYPSQSVVVVGWIVAVVTEIRTTYYAYRMPMLAAQERYSIFMSKLFSHRSVLSFDEVTEYCPRQSGNVEIEKWTKCPETGEQADNQTGQENPPVTMWIYWKQYFTYGYRDSIDSVCLALLKGGHGVMSRLGTEVKFPWREKKFYVRQRVPPLDYHKGKDDIYDRITYFEKGTIMTWLYRKKNAKVSKSIKEEIERRNLLELRLQYALRLRLFNNLARLLGVFAFQAAFVSLLLSFHALWRQSTDINVLLVESAILPVLSYARARSGQTSVDPITEQRVKWMMKKSVVNAEKEATYTLEECKEKEALDRQQQSSDSMDRKVMNVQTDMLSLSRRQLKSNSQGSAQQSTTSTDNGHRREGETAVSETPPLLPIDTVPESASVQPRTDEDLTEVSDFEPESASEYRWDDDTY